MVFSVGLHVASVVLGVAAWIDAHLPAQALVPLAEGGLPRPTAHGPRSSKMQTTNPLSTKRTAPEEWSRRVDEWVTPSEDDNLFKGVSSERYERSA
jgi:hypothetical protein